MPYRKHNATGRSTGANAGKLGKLNRPPKGEPWAWLTCEMLESVAFRALGINARRVLDRIIVEHLHHAGLENGGLICRYQDFEDYGVTRRYIHDAIEELTFFGFITVRSGRPDGIRRPPNIFRLTWLPKGDAAPATNQWKAMDEDRVQAWLDRKKVRARKKSRSKTKSPADNCRPSKATNVVKSRYPELVKLQNSATSS